MMYIIHSFIDHILIIFLEKQLGRLEWDIESSSVEEPCEYKEGDYQTCNINEQ
jgi:hypothetical protein